jgi:asparagine N-glycosylation enzyme membrane subunit Stt3
MGRILHHSCDTDFLCTPAVLIGITGFSWGGYFIIHAILIFYALILTTSVLVKRDSNKQYKSYLWKTWVLICSSLFFGTIIALILYPVRGPVEILRATQMLGFAEGPLVYKFTSDLMPPRIGSFESLLVYKFTSDLMPPRLESFESLFGTFLLVGIVLTAVGVYGLYKRDGRNGLYLIAALLATMIPAVRAVHFMDMFSLFVYISLGIGASFILERIQGLERQKSVWKKLASVAVIVIMVIAFVNPVIGSVNEIRYSGGYVIQPEKKAAFLYLQNNTAADSLFINWWDYGNSLAYFAKRRPVIDQMYIPDEAVKAVSAVIVATDPDKGLQIARTLKQKHNSSEVYLMLFWYDAYLMPIMGYAVGYNLTPSNESIRMYFDDNERLVGRNELTNRTNYYRLWTNQSIEGYTPFYVKKEVKIFRLDV